MTRHVQHRFVVSLLSLLAFAPGMPLAAQTEAAAKVVSLAGQVSVLHDGNTWALNAGDLVQPQQVIVTGPDSYAVFQVSDGSTFDVYPNARVIFRNNRGDWKDLLEILLGKVKVQIQHLGGQPNHNKVRTPTAVIAVRGTVFDVDVEDTDATTLVLVEEGQVEVRHLLEPGQTRFLNPGEWIRVFKNQPLAVKTVDRGFVLQKLVRAASDALNEALYRMPRGASPGTAATGASGTTADTPGTPPPPSGSKPPP
ncbi:MAG: FecR domain-containing protein, partial [Acidobacteriota bacterium]|nr:FecR domain-containing protein [Acidobacteriota bacterium]